MRGGPSTFWYLAFLPSVDIYAHIGGFLGGFALDYAGAPGRNKAIELFWQGAAFAMVALNGYAFYKMYDWQRICHRVDVGSHSWLQARLQAAGSAEVDPQARCLPHLT